MVELLVVQDQETVMKLVCILDFQRAVLIVEIIVLLVCYLAVLLVGPSSMFALPIWHFKPSNSS